MDEVSNGGFLPFSAGAVLSPLPGELNRQYGPCDYDVRDNLTANYVYQLPFKARERILGAALKGWQVSGTAFWHSGLPFSVLSTPYWPAGTESFREAGRSLRALYPACRCTITHPFPESRKREPFSG